MITNEDPKTAEMYVLYRWDCPHCSSVNDTDRKEYHIRTCEGCGKSVEVLA